MTNVRSIATALVLAAALIAAPTASAQGLPGTAQDKMPTDTEAWTEQIGDQLAALLQSEAPGTRAKAMKLIVHYGNLESSPVTLDPTVQPLLDIYRAGEEDGERILALSALSAIGSEKAMQKIARVARVQKDDRVRQHAMRILTIHQRESQ